MVLSQLGLLVWKPGGYFFGVEAPPAVVGVAELGLFVFVPAIIPLKAKCC